MHKYEYDTKEEAEADLQVAEAYYRDLVREVLAGLKPDGIADHWSDTDMRVFVGRHQKASWWKGIRTYAIWLKIVAAKDRWTDVDLALRANGTVNGDRLEEALWEVCARRRSDAMSRDVSAHNAAVLAAADLPDDVLDHVEALQWHKDQFHVTFRGVYVSLSKTVRIDQIEPLVRYLQDRDASITAGITDLLHEV